MNMESQVLQVNLDDIIPNRFQPRLAFDEQGIKELASSIKEHGIIQPLVLRKLGNKYEIIAGERRYKAATLAGLTKVPAVISNIDDNKSAEIALVENIQRRDLTPIEEARSYKNLLDKGYLTQEELAKKMGLSQPAIANKLRLLNLDESVQQALLDGKISERHARSLLVLPSLEDQKTWLNRIITERLTVRQLDQELKKLSEPVMENKDNIEDIPKVAITPNIEEIKSRAEDINPQDHRSVASMLVPEDTLTEYSSDLPNSNINMSENINNNINDSMMVNSNPMNKFFSSLENEPASLNPNNGFANENIFNMNPTDNNDIEIFDVPVEPAKNVAEDIVDPIKETSTPVDNFDLNPNNRFFQPAPKAEEEINISIPEQPVINPMDFVETLDSNYEQKTQELAGVDLRSTINEIRGFVNDLHNKGVNIQIDEAATEESYQINLTLPKNN